MYRYKQINAWCGWISFLLSAVVYVLTLEPSASFWDCSEFITSAAKLEIGHPPGAPFFMLLGNPFTHFAPDTQWISYTVNLMNALLSAGTVLFLFRTITRLSYLLFMRDTPEEKLCIRQIAILMISGFVGAFSFAFSDTFWYSAVEAEVYAFSSFLTALTFWLILRWEKEAESVSADRWLVFLAFVIGISIGVHLLNLLCIPTIGLVFYYKKWKKTTWKGITITLLLSGFVVAIILFGMIPGIVRMAGYWELLLVNGLSFPYYSGMLLYAVCLLAILSWSVYESGYGKHTKRLIIASISAWILLGITCREGLPSSLLLWVLLVVLSSYILHRLYIRCQKSLRRFLSVLNMSLLVLVLGYSSYALIVIRAAANPPMNEQSPYTPFALKGYLGREQYGNDPLLYGQTYATPLLLKEENGSRMYARKLGEAQYDRPYWEDNREKKGYVQTGYKEIPEYQPEGCVWFPRMWDSQRANSYENWMGGVQKKTVSYYDECERQMQTMSIPTTWEELRYFFTYQMNFMYWRYFMWNFVGRQNDHQGNGGEEYGNWITGISLIDRLLVGTVSSDMPDNLQNKGCNVYYALPLLLGLIGLCGQFRRSTYGRKQCSVIMMLFLMTGLAIVFYLNQWPAQPRERDYAYAGSFYAFSIWIGMGAAVAAYWVQKRMRSGWMMLLGSAVMICIPLQMLAQNWDDHDRSRRYLCPDMAQNYLNSVQEEGEPILFVNGDNETFPLWYATEVEGVRQDVRVCNLMYMTGAWYIEQMRCPAYSSSALPISIPSLYCHGGVNEIVPVNPVVGREHDGYGKTRELRISDAIREMYSTGKNEQVLGEDPFEWNNIVKHWLTSPHEEMRCIPTDEIHIPIDKEAVRRSGMYIPEGVEVPDTMTISLKGRNYLTRSALVLIDLIRQCNWERPLYVAITTGLQEYIDLSEHLLREGLVYRIVPYCVPKDSEPLMDTKRMYQTAMNHYRFGGLDRDIYLDKPNLEMALTLQNELILLAEELYEEGQKKQAQDILDLCTKEIKSPDLLQYPYTSLNRIGVLYGLLGQCEKGREWWQKSYRNSMQYADWYSAMEEDFLLKNSLNYARHLYRMGSMGQEAASVGLIDNEHVVPELKQTLSEGIRKLRKCGKEELAQSIEVLMRELQMTERKDAEQIAF